MTLKLGAIGGRSKVTSSIVITLNHEYNSMCRRKKHSPIPLKYMDVTRCAYADLDVMQEKKIYDYWNVDSWSLRQILGEDSQIHLIEREASDRIQGEIDEDSNDLDENW